MAAAAEQGIDVDVFDRVFTDVATSLPFDKLAQAVQAYLNALEPDGPEPDPTEERSLTIARRADGGVCGRFDLAAVGGEVVQAALASIVQADRPLGDTRTRAQQQADALVQLSANQLAAGGLPMLRTVKPHVALTIDLDDLADPATGHDAATMGFGATLSAARARWLTCDATITRIVLGPDGLPLDVGRTHRVVPTHLRRAVEKRDGHCVFGACHAPTHWCEVHHLVHWIAGGETSLDNSALLCERHHTKIHHGFTVVRDDGAPPGRPWRTYRPDGTRICTERLPV